MNEKDIFNEKQVYKEASMVCPHCHIRDDYRVRWIERTKKKNISSRISEHDRTRFEKSRDYLVRVDDVLVCRNGRCRKSFEIPNSQSVVFI
ncbi:MAG: hypothetical protein ACK5NT_02530 [Pyrinomonadaceae bacterium]